MSPLQLADLVTDKPDPLTVLYKTTATRMADEGVPVAAIARALQLSSETVWELLHDSMNTGKIIELPPSDWPPGSQRQQRRLQPDSILRNTDLLRLACARCFKTTRLQSAMLATILKRGDVTKTQLHDVIEEMRVGGNDAKEPTDLKMVDVIICHLRRKLRPFKIELQTVWGTGYRIEHPDCHRAVLAMEAALDPTTPATEQVLEAA